MLQRLELDESEILQLTKETNEEKEVDEERKSDNNKLKEIMKIMDGLPLALIHASGSLSKDLEKIRIKEGKLLSKTNMNQVFENYLQNYHELFDTTEANGGEYQIDIENSFDDAEFRRRFYEEHVKNKPKFQFLEEKLGVIDFEDYQLVQTFSANDWNEYDIKPLHQERFDHLRKDEQKMLKD
jgi:hypothetical protein